ncbi:MAG: SpoIIE family protein phosphatase [Leptospirales bacterium]|nr:SpoIIE family protein phosphatase [Leptospirales bacterium]
MFESVYFNFYSVGAMIAAIMSLAVSLSLVSLPGRSRATLNLGLALLLNSTLNLGYVVCSSWYAPEAALHRWFTVFGGITQSVFLTQFFFLFPQPIYPRLRRSLLVMQLLVVVAVMVYWILHTLQAPRIYQINAHLWNFDADQYGTNTANVIGVFALFQSVLGVWRGIVSRGRGRLACFLIGLVLFVVGVGQSIASKLTQEGRIDRSLYQILYTLSVILALFSIAIVYLNGTADRSSFMIKVVGVSLLTILLIFMGISYFELRDREAAYDTLRRDRIALALGLGQRFDDLEYIRPLAPPGPALYQRDASLQLDTLQAAPGYDPSRSAASNSRGYRLSADGLVHYVSYGFRNPADGALLEAGFNYRKYRAAMHEAARRFVAILSVSMLVIVAGYPFFFRNVLIIPLRRLIAAVRRVNEGDLTAQTPVQIEDEIGYLSRSFNGMVASIREARQGLQDYADQLEQKVHERTAELEQSLHKVQELKSQQDGDYFLTSLLLRPLSANRSRNENVAVEFLVRQMKKFSFRHWSEEIGGDLCMAHSVRLRERNYAVFMNADAMGKSMQGAGGALVLGAVFEALIERTQLAPDARSQHPERWLKNAFVELHKVFEVFDGSMLVSLVLGLVDDETGLLYYINAEHPYSVLYRDGKAAFVEESLIFRKLGTLGLDGRISIRTLQLEPGDIIICGSDGRDDLRITGADGAPMIQEDETAFLRHVEKGDGLLPKIYSAVLDFGQQTDDLSLIRIAFKEDHALGRDAASEETQRNLNGARELLAAGDANGAVRLLEAVIARDAENRKALRLLATAYFRLKRYDRAAQIAEDYTLLRPADTDFLFLTSYCNKKVGRYDLAADFGERVRLREPDHVQNLTLLAEVHLRLGNMSRARLLAEHALQREPENQRALTLLNQLPVAAE